MWLFWKICCIYEKRPCHLKKLDYVYCILSYCHNICFLLLTFLLRVFFCQICSLFNWSFSRSSSSWVLGKMPPVKMPNGKRPRENCAPDNCPPGKLPPRKIADRKISSLSLKRKVILWILFLSNFVFIEIFLRKLKLIFLKIIWFLITVCSLNCFTAVYFLGLFLVFNYI